MQYNGYVNNFKFVVPGSPPVAEFELGYVPGWIRILNLTNGFSLEWNGEMADATEAFVRDAAGARVVISADAITKIENQAEKFDGFSLGNLDDFNTGTDTGDVLFITALREGKC